MGTGGAGFGKVFNIGVQDCMFRFRAGVLYCVSIKLECVEGSVTESRGFMVSGFRIGVKVSELVSVHSFGCVCSAK